MKEEVLTGLSLCMNDWYGMMIVMKERRYYDVRQWAGVPSIA
tara:strand:+ start:402 stop:527 length:126 start_codon:yes stop_codon:yes gene_type:complete